MARDNRRTPLAAPALILAAALAVAGPAAAQQADEPDPRVEAAERYAECMQTARSDPERALGTARTWQDQGGGDPARHCIAVSLLSLGRYAEAAERLEELGRTMSGPAVDAQMRADTLAQAGQAWLLAGRPERAQAAQSAALELRPKDVELLIDRALTLAQAGEYWEAIDDLNRADELAPGRADILVFRASAYRYVDALELAREDVNRALELDPDNPEGLLERGIIRRLSGDKQGARHDWLKLIDLHDGTPAADTARRNLERMDVQTEDGKSGG